jgi:hypothetical protein
MTAGRICYDGVPADLAQVAEGRIWEIRQLPGRPVELPEGCKLVDEVPDSGGGTRLRVLCAVRPHEQAEPVVPGIEDGYLQLMNQGAA